MAAVAKYDDVSERDVSDSVTWEIVGDPTVASISISGLVTGNNKGDTELIAKKDGITSDMVNVTVCDDLGGRCIDTFDTGSGKLFTNSPSVAYLDSIGGSATTQKIVTETTEPTGDFYTFTWDYANELCDTYNTNSIGGRTNWRLATKDELEVELYNAYGDMTAARGWPNGSNTYYWTADYDPDDPYSYVYIALDDGYSNQNGPGPGGYYASCVSNP